MSIANKLTYLEETKSLIKEKMNDLGAELTQNNTFREYAERLASMYDEFPKVPAEGSNFALTGTKKGKMQIIPLGNTTQNTSILPSEYQQVEYIESTGTQYINTGYVPSDTTGISLKLFNNNSGSDTVFTGSRSFPDGRFWIGKDTTNTVYFGWNTVTKSTFSAVSNTIFTIKMNYLNDRKMYIKNTLISNISDSLKINTSPIYIFAGRNIDNAQYYSSINLYNLKISENKVLVRDFIPCYRKSDNEIGLYDLVNNVFYTNAGTGTFLKGNDVNIPNPDYPQEIKNVTGNNTVKIGGKNILNVKSENITQSNWLDYNENMQTFTIKQGVGRAPVPIPIDIDLVVGDTITVSVICESGQYSGTSTNISIGTYHNGDSTSWQGQVSLPRGEDLKDRIFSSTHIITAEINSLMPFIYGNPTIDKDIVFKVQVEKNSTATPYEPYIEPIEKELNLRGDDYNYNLMKDDYITEDCVIHHKRKKVDLSILNWSVASTNMYYASLSNAKIPSSDNINPLFFAEKYISSSRNGIGSGKICISQTSNLLCYDTTGTPTGILEYELAEETIETIPNTIPLYNQIKDLYRTIILGGAIIVETESEEENVPLIVRASALKG